MPTGDCAIGAVWRWHETVSEVTADVQIDDISKALPASGGRCLSQSSLLLCGAADADHRSLTIALEEHWRSLGEAMDGSVFRFRPRLINALTADVPLDIGSIPPAGFDGAALIVDAATPLSPEARRQACLCYALGVRELILIVNRMDLAGFDEGVFSRRVAEVTAYFRLLGLTSAAAVPLGSLSDGNAGAGSAAMPWYTSASLHTLLAEFAVRRASRRAPVRFAVTSVAERIVCGTPINGEPRQGDALATATGERKASVLHVEPAEPSGAVGTLKLLRLALSDDIGIVAGDVLSSPLDRPSLSDHFAAHIAWLGPGPLLPQRAYVLSMAGNATSAQVTAIKYRADCETLAHLAARHLAPGDIAFCNIATGAPVTFDEQAGGLGTFTLSDRTNGSVVGLGRIAFGLRRATNVYLESLYVDKANRARAKRQQPTVIWLTGLSGSGKSTIAKRLEKELHERGHHTYVLDGDNVRHGLNRDLGFTDTDRIENIRRIGEVAKLFVDAGLIVLCSFISPFRAERQMVRESLDAGEFVEVFVDAPLDVCRHRDPKKLYAKADAGKIRNFTGIDSPYEPPLTPELHLRTAEAEPHLLVSQIVSFLERQGRI